MKQTPAQYVISFQAEPSYKGRRHHWMICRAQNPDELVSWGHEPTRELAEAAAGRELQDLSAGVTQRWPGDDHHQTVHASCLTLRLDCLLSYLRCDSRLLRLNSPVSTQLLPTTPKS